MKILVLCCDYPPLNSAGAQRPASWRRYLPDIGIDVQVIASDRGGPTVCEAGVERVYLPPAPSDRILSRFGPERVVVPRKLLSFLFKLGGFTVPWLDKHRGLLDAATHWLEGHTPDAILATGEPFVLFCHAARLSDRFRVPWVADYRDGWFLNHVVRRDSRPAAKALRAYERRIERRIVPSARLITAVDSHLASELGVMHGVPTAVVPNGFAEIYQGVADRAGTDSRTLLLTHAGTITPGQRVEFLCQALRDLASAGDMRPGDLLLRFVGVRAMEAQWRRIQQCTAGIEAFVETTDRVARPQALAWIAGSDFLVSLTEPDYTAIFMKTYDYLAAGRPILVVPADGALLDGVVQECGAGRSFRDRRELVRFLREALQAKASGTWSESVQDRSARLKHSRRHQAEALAGALRAHIV